MRDHPDVDAAICFNDLVALGMMARLARAGVMPGRDFRLTGFDDIEESAQVWPGLSSVSCDITSFGQKTAATLLDWLVEGRKPAAERLEPVHLVQRASSTGDPSRLVQPPALPRRLPHPLSIDQVEALIDAAGRPGTGRDATERALRDRALLEVLYGLGARISEATGLDIDDIDQAERAAVLRGKGDKHRAVPVGRFALEALEAYLTRGRPTLAARGSGTPAVFLGSRGTRLTRQAAWQVVAGAAEAAELTDLPEPVSPHTLRHSYATHLLHGGADVRSVQELLGHASVTTTQLYTQVTVDTLRETHAGAHPRAR